MISEAAAKWLASGERGLSSEAMFTKFTGIQIYRSPFSGHPHDPDDFQRCEKLLRAVPEFRDKLPLMAEVSPKWGALVLHWGAIAALLEEEVPGIFEGKVVGRAPKTYDLMKLVLDEAKSQ